MTATPHIFIRADDQWSIHYADFRLRWIETARPKQLPPPGEWRTWAVVAGRGFGKTRIGAEEAIHKALAAPKQRIAVAAPTYNDCRGVCFEGQSGILELLPKFFRRRNDYTRKPLELKLPNESILIGYTAEKPDRFRGPQHHFAWCDELASWGAVVADGRAAEGPRLKDAWSNMDFGLRLGRPSRAVITTTPRPIKFLKDLLKTPGVVMTRGSIFDNADNLDPNALASLRRIYEGTRLGRQELYGDILAENDNALWKYSMFDREGFRLDAPRSYVRVVVAIDPAVTSVDSSDETGIVVAGITEGGEVDLIHDASGKYRPDEWAREALALYSRFNADAIVGETNQGGDLIEANLAMYSNNKFFAFIGVHAKKGKYLRAEPVAACYERGIVRHVGNMGKLESQMCEFTGSSTGDSPDRLDAAVYAVTELILGNQQHAFY